MAIVVKREFIRASQSLPAPEDFDGLIRDAWEGAKRIVVQALDGDTGTYRLFNSFSFTVSGFGKEPEGVEPEDAIDEAMAMIAADLLERGELQWSYQVQVFPHTEKKKRSVPTTAKAKITIQSGKRRRADAAAFDLSLLKTIDGHRTHEGRLVDALLKGMDVLSKALDTERKHSEALTDRARADLERTRLEIEERAAVKAETVAIEAEKEVELAKLQRQDDFLEMFRPMIDSAVATKAVEIAKGSRKKKGKPTALALTAAGQSNDKAIAPAEAEADDEAKTEEDEADDALAEEHPDLYVCRVLIEGMGDDQTAKAIEILGAERWEKVTAAAGTESNDDCLAALRIAFDGVTNDQTAALMRELEEKQITLIGSLRFAVERTASGS